MKNILLAVTGLTPQVITETLYALHQNQQRVDEIHIVTTRSGKEAIYSRLIGGRKGYFYRYLDDYDIEKNSILFGHSSVHVVSDEDGNEIEDISNAEENEKLLAKCLELAFEFTSDRETSVFFSIAGGRKTMSSCLTLAAQLYGRPQDRLYHVLVSPEFENNRDFFYPPVTSHKIELFDNKGQPYYKETKFAEITLVNIPFVSLRRHLSEDQLKTPKDPGTLMLSLVKDEQSRFIINLPEKKILYKTIELDMMPAHMALYAFFIMQKRNCKKDNNNCKGCYDCFMEVAEIGVKTDEIARIYRSICGSRPIENTQAEGITSLSGDNFRSLRSRINKRLAKTFGRLAAKEMEITSIGTRPDTRYGILMDKKHIQMVI